MSLTSKDMSKMPVFDGDDKNWTSWKRLLRSYLRRHSKKEFDLLDATTKQRNSPRPKTQVSASIEGASDEHKAREQDSKPQVEVDNLKIKLYDTLVLTCRGQAAAVISTLPDQDDEDGAKAWLALLAKYEVHTRARFVVLHHQLMHAQLDMANPDKYFHTIDLLRKQLSEVSSDRRLMSDEEMISFALFALPSDVAYLRSVLEADSNLTYAMLKNHVRSHAEGSSSGNNTNEEKALASMAAASRFRGTCFKCGRRGHRANQCKNAKSNSKPSQMCSNCGRPGHDSKTCYAPGGDKHHASVAHTKSREYAFSTIAGADSTLWIVDSGCTAHMTCERSDLSNLRNITPTEVVCGGDAVLVSRQAGTVSIATKSSSGDPTTLVLHHVLYVPGLGKRLFSVKKFAEDKSSNRVLFSHKGNIVSTDQVEIRLREHDKLYVFPRMKSEMSLTSVAQLWHRRLGHVNQVTVSKVLDSNPKLKHLTVPDHTCEDCAQTKSTRTSFRRAARRRSTAKLQLVHSDVWGPISPTSVGGAKYAVIFVDDYTRVKKLYFMTRKSEVPEKFQSFIDEVARPENLKIARLRSDCGGEYKSARMQKLCLSYGIRQEFSAPYSQEQNGVAERSWRTLGRMAKAMLKDAGLSKTFWAEAMETASFIANRLPTNALSGDNPYHRWTRCKPDYERFRVFGCPVYVHVHRKQDKLQDNAIKCIFLGYDYYNPRAYRVWNPKTRKVMTSAHVRFQEQGGLHGSQQPEQKAQEEPLVQYQNMYQDQLPSRGPRDANDSFMEQTDGPESESDSKLSDDADSDCSLGADDDMCDIGQADGDTKIQEHTPQSALDELPPPGNAYNLRTRRAPRHTAMAAITCDEPTYREALAGPQATEWKKAMKAEYDALVANGTWDVVPRPKGMNIIGSKWVLRVKRNADGSVCKFKARFVARGFSQVFGEDYFETFSPVTQCTSIRCLVALAAQHGWKLYQMDVCSAFLNADVQEEIYVRPPPGMEGEMSGQVLRLRKSLYGLKQAPRNWNGLLDSFLLSVGLKKSAADPCLYSNGHQVMVTVWVDDLILTGAHQQRINKLKTQLSNRFKMKDEGELNWCLGMRIITHQDGHITMDQEQYIKTMLARFKMSECKPASTPAALGVRLLKQDGPQTKSEIADMKEVPYRAVPSDCFSTHPSERAQT